jgi:C4-dicarboxylate-specific signal transduction histidine kinase
LWKVLRQLQGIRREDGADRLRRRDTLMEHTRQMTKSVSGAGPSSVADVPIEDVYPLAHAVEDQSDRFEYADAPIDDIAAESTQDALARVRGELAHVTRLMTLDELTASIAHEVIQPLAAIVANGEACLRWLGREEHELGEARANVVAMISSALRSSDIIRRLRALSTNGDLQKLELNLNEVIKEVIPLIESDVLRHRVELRVNLAAELSSVLGDRVQLQQVVINLLVNGIQAMASVSGRPRELLIRSRPHDVNHVVVTVQDSGTGIDPNHIDRLFNAFFTTKVDGMGMGLCICRSIIEAHGGLIWASGNSGYGAAFHFALPTIRARAA